MESLPADDVEGASNTLSYSYHNRGFDTNPDMHITIVSENILPEITHEPNSTEDTPHFATRVHNICSLRWELYAYASQNMWPQARCSYEEYNYMVCIPLTTNGDTALHVAATANSGKFVEGLVNLKYMTPEDLEITNVDGNTAFCIAAITGNGDLFPIMIHKNEKLPEIPGQDGMLPVHLAALNGHHKIVVDLSSEKSLEKMDFNDIKELFFLTIDGNMYDVATKLVDKYSEKLVTARYGTQEITALHMLMRKPSKLSMEIPDPAYELSLDEYASRMVFEIISPILTAAHEFGLTSSQSTDTLGNNSKELLQKLWFHVTQLKHEEIVELITQPSVVLFDAIKSGYVEAVKWLLYNNRDLLTIKDPVNGKNLLHYAILCKQPRILYFILKMDKNVVNSLLRAVDKDHNNVLHFAAPQPRTQETQSSSGPIKIMQREFMWFKEVEKEVEKAVPTELKSMRNKDGMTPLDMLHTNHENISKEVTAFATRIANAGMVVAALVATIAFAAALTVPGDKSSTSFLVFFLSNAIALFTSAAAVVAFSTIFMRSRFTSDSIDLLQHKLSKGHIYVFLSIVAMVVAFVAASFLIFDSKHKGVSYVVIILGICPIWEVFKIFKRLVEMVGTSRSIYHSDAILLEKIIDQVYSLFNISRYK